jgi:hypothetical protein
MQVEELSIRLPFGRKPADITDIAATGDYVVYVTETREMEPEEFDGFAKNLSKSRDWLKGKGGYFMQGRLCVEIHAPGRPYLFIDPSGGDYRPVRGQAGLNRLQSRFLLRHRVTDPHCLFPGELLPTLDDHVDVLGIKFDEPGTAS